MLTQTIKSWGNGLALRLPKIVAAQVGLKEGDEVSIDEHDGELVLRHTKPEYRLEDLLNGITKDNQPESFDTPPVGGELL